MFKNMITVMVLASCILLGQAQSAQATSGIRTAWRNYYSPGTTLMGANCLVCHPTTKGLTFNSYGSALQTRIGNQGMAREAAFIDAEGIDSDGDGYTNGQEIVIDDTMPGDGGSHGAVADQANSWGQVKTLFR